MKNHNKKINLLKCALVWICCQWLVANATAQCRQLVWADEFNGSTLNTNNWSFDVGGGGWGNNELQYYTDRTDNANVSSGTLKIVAKSESYGGRNYTSARLVSKFKADFRYGRIEARLKLPQTQGIWPAFWLLPTDNVYGGWPNSGEIDIMELLGHQPNRTYATLHAQGATAGTSIYSSSNYTLPTGSFADDFHIFAVEWTSSELKFYVDNTVIATKTAADLAGSPRPFPFDQRFHLLLNIAVGGNWPGNPNGTTVFPQTMEVDYVRVYQSLGEANITVPTRTPLVTATNFSLPFAADATYTWTGDAHTTLLSGQNTATPTAEFANAGGTLTATANSPTCGSFSGSIFVETAHNWFKNPSFETTNFSNWSPRPNGYGTITDIAGGAYQGSRHAVVNVPTAAPNPWDIQLSYANLALVAGQSYTLRFWAKADQANRQISAAVVNSTTYSTYFHQNINLSTTWTEYSYTFTASTSANSLFNFDCGRGGVFYFDYALFAPTETLLPLEILAFSAKKNAHLVNLDWQLAQNKNLSRLEIERSDDSKKFKTIFQENYIGFNFQNLKNAFQDTPPSTPAFYRLKLTEKDGAVLFSKIISVDEETAKPQFRISPNPVDDALTLRILSGEVQRVRVVNSFGQILLEKNIDSPIDALQISTVDWTSGVYFLQATSIFNVMETIKFVKR